MSRRFSIMAALNIIQPCSDVSDIIPLFPQQGLYLKPIAKLNISVHLPTLKLPGKTISNYEVMEKLKFWTIPDEFTSLKVSKNTLEFIRFEAEIESRSKLSQVLARLDGRFIKLSGFTESLKVRAAEAKCDFPSRHNWDSYFRDAKNMNEMKPGERPDTIHITNLPCKWFASKSNPEKPSEYILRKVFETFGEVRCVDIPSIDSYRTRMKAHISGIKMFSYHQNVVFEGYIQFKEYVFFMKAMDTLRGMKLIYKDDSKIFSASIKVDFDKTKHLSDSIIKKRRYEREKMMAEEREREEQERLKKEKEEAEKEAERKRKLKEKEDKLARRKQREEKRKLKQLEKLKLKEADDMNRKIASEERLLLMAQRRLESIRLLSELLKRVEEATLKKIKEKQKIEKIIKKDKGKKGNKNLELKLLAHKEEEELRHKLIEKLKSNDSTKSSNKEDVEPGSSKARNVLVSSVSGTVPISSASEGVSSLISSSESDMSDNDNTTNRGGKDEQPFSEKYHGVGRTGGIPWYPHHRSAAMGFNPYSVMGNTFGRPHRPYYSRGRRGFRWPRYPGRGRGGYMPRYIDPLLLDINHQYYKYFHKLTHSRTSRSSRSNSYSRSRSRSRSRDSHHRSRTRSRSYSRRYSRSRSHSWSPSLSRSRSRSLSRRPSHRSRRRSRSYSSTSYHSDRSKSHSRHQKRSRSNSYDNSKRSHSRSRNKSPLQEKQHQSSDSKHKHADSHSGSESKEKSGRKKTRWDTDMTSDNRSDSKSSVKDHGNTSNNSDKTIKNRDHLGKKDKADFDSTKHNIDDRKHKKSPVRFPSLTHTWSRSPSPSRSLSWEKKETSDNKDKECHESKNRADDGKNQNSKRKKEGKKHKKKKKHCVKEK